MFSFWGRPASALAVITLGCLALWPLVGLTVALAVYSSILMGLLVYHLTRLDSLQQWLQDPRRDTLPATTGLWDLVYARIARMLRLQSQSELRLSAALERFQQAGEAMPDGMAILDENNHIEWCNSLAERHFGIQFPRDQGHHITNIVRDPGFVDYLQAQNFGEPLILKQIRDKAEIVLSIQLVPYGDKQKLITSRDITRWDKIETVRKDFVANVSHELRTPITVIGGFLETLSDLPEADPEMMRRSIQLMREQATRMQRLVEDLLTLSKLEHTENPSFEKQIDVPQLLRSLYQDALTLSKDKHSLELLLDSDDSILGNEEELRSAFSNLVSNAIRYTPKGGSITLAWKREGDGVSFSVQDTGIGIEPQHIPRLTERFYRVDRSRSRETGGTGLGLAIVKHVLNRHQAKLEITSVLGEGSCFKAIFSAQRVVKATTLTKLEKAS